MYYLALRFYLLVVYYLCQSSDPSLSEPRPQPSVPPWRCAHPPAAPAPYPPPRARPITTDPPPTLLLSEVPYLE